MVVSSSVPLDKPQGHPLVPYGTPLHMSELVLALFRLTFADYPEDHPFRYTDDFETTGVLFDVDANKASEAWGARPLIVVTRGPQSAGPIMTGDRAALSKAHDHQTGSTLVSASVEVQVRGRLKAETDILAQHIFAMLTACRTILPRFTGAHMVQNVSLSPVARDDQDDTQFVARLSLAYVMQYAWTRVLPADPLRCLDLALGQDGLGMVRERLAPKR